MYQHLRLLGRFFLLYLLSFGVLASIIESSFFPQVTIVKNAPSDTIEIKAKQTDFVALYMDSIGTFKPFDIPFTVRSVDGSILKYAIKLQSSQHYCRNEGGVDNALLNVVSTTLDGKAFPPFDSGLPGSEGLSISGKKSEHVMHVLFSSIPQQSVTQICYGTFVLIAEVAEL